MSETKAAAKGEEQPKAKKAKPAQDAYSPKKSTKPEWTAERCAKFAKRFESVDAWKTGAPSSYKAAEARGWVAQCSKHMSSGARKAPLRKSA